MNLLSIMLQAPVSSVYDAASTQSLYLFWGLLLFCVVTFFYFLRRTDKIIESKIGYKKPEANKTASPITEEIDVHGEEAAAIALAIHLYKSHLHDMESLTITLNKVSRIYSPWSSKIYTLRQNPRYK